MTINEQIKEILEIHRKSVDWKKEAPTFNDYRANKIISLFQPKTTSTDIEELKKLLRKTILEEPNLQQYENRDSAPFYCSLCDMSELDIMDRKSDGRFYCRCSYWTDPHNAYMDKSGGKWLGWYDEDYAQRQAEEKDIITSSYNEAIRDVINLHLSNKSELKKEAVREEDK